MRKKLLALLMAVTMVASMAGCGAKEEKIELTVWAPSEDQSEETGNWLQTKCEKFDEAHPEWDITFTYGVCPEGDA